MYFIIKASNSGFLVGFRCVLSSNISGSYLLSKSARRPVESRSTLLFRGIKSNINHKGILAKSSVGSDFSSLLTLAPGYPGMPFSPYSPR